MSRPVDAALAADVLAHLRSARSEMVDRLGALVDLDSPTDDPMTLTAPRRLVAGWLDEVGYRTREVAATGVADHLFARPADRRRGRPVQLLVGHLDTVWPLGEAIQRPATVTDGELAGPGSFDMKAGVVQLVAALECLQHLAVPTPAAPVVFCNSDEEIGSPDSRRWITWLAGLSTRAFVLEGSLGTDGALKVGRKGVGRYVVRAKGIAAHAGLDPATGASAVLEIAQQIQVLFGLNDPGRGITVNVGTVDGGLRPNVIAPEATAQVDVRATTLADATELDQAIRALVPVNPEVTLVVEGGFGRPPMEANQANRELLARAEAIGAALGLAIRGEVVGGASDGNLTSQRTATLDGLGAVGDGAHRLDERVRLDAMPERAALLALLLASPIDPEGSDAAVIQEDRT